MNNLENILESVLFIAGNGVDASEIAEKLGVNVADVMDAAIRLKEGKYGGNSGIVVTIYNNKIISSSLHLSK